MPKHYQTYWSCKPTILMNAIQAGPFVVIQKFLNVDRGRQVNLNIFLWINL